MSLRKSKNTTKVKSASNAKSAVSNQPAPQAGVGQARSNAADPAGNALQRQTVSIKQIQSLQKIQPFNYMDVAFGKKQDIPSAPLVTPVGFTTAIPYNTGINASILVNPCPISTSNMWSIVMSDPVVFGSMLYLITCIISRVGDYCNPSSKKIQKEVRKALKRVGKRKLLQGLLTSLWAGYADIRLYWGKENGKDIIEKIQILPPNSTLLCVTPEGELDKDVGVIQYYYNSGTQILQNSQYFSQYGNAPLASFGSEMIPQRQMALNSLYGTALPTDYVIHHVHNPIGLEGNLLGTSMVQPIYQTVMNKVSQLERIAIASTYKASPMIVFFTDTNTVVDYGNGQFASMKQNVQDNVPDGLASGVFVIEGKNAVDMQTVDNTADLEKMLAPVYFYNEEIRTGLVTPDLVGNSGSYANATANGETNSDIIDYFAESIIETLMEQFVGKIIEHSVDDKDKIDDHGYFELRDNSLEERAIWAKVLEMSKNLGVLNPKSLDDYNFIRRKMGLRAEDAMDAEVTKIFMDAMTADSKPDNVNINKTKQDVGKKYANGGAKAITQGKNRKSA